MSEVSLLVILDGFGYREEVKDNAIAQAHTPTWDTLWATRPHTLFQVQGKMWDFQQAKWATQKSAIWCSAQGG